MASIPDDPVVPPPVTGDRPLTRVMNMAGAYGLRNHTVKSIRDLKGVRQLVEILPFFPGEAAAAEAAGIDTMKVRFSRDESRNERQSAFHIREAAPHTFMSFVLPLTEVTSETGALRAAFDAMEAGADAIMCQFGLPFVEVLAKAGVPVQGHVGLVPRKSTWTGGLRAVGKTVDEAVNIHRDLKDLENAGAWAAECEVIPAPIMRELSARTTLVTASIGSGSGGDIQFLFAQDILGDGEPPFPRHAKRYCNLHEMRQGPGLLREVRKLWDEEMRKLWAKRMPEWWDEKALSRLAPRDLEWESDMYGRVDDDDRLMQKTREVIRKLSRYPIMSNERVLSDHLGHMGDSRFILGQYAWGKMQEMRIAAFRKFVAEVRIGAFPGPEHVVDVDRDVVDGFLEAIGG